MLLMLGARIRCLKSSYPQVIHSCAYLRSLYPQLRVILVWITTPLVFDVTINCLVSHMAINTLKINEIGELNTDPSPFSRHRYADFRIKELCQEVFQFQ